MSPRSRKQERDQEAAIVYTLETTAQRELENKVTQQQKMELVGQLAGGIAHDFNNVLSAIIMATDFLLNAHKPTDPSFGDIMQIKQNANRAASLVRHLLAFSRKQTLRPQVLDLGEVLSDLTMLLRRLIGEKVTLEVVHGRDLWPVKADISQFEQVIVNLAVNARDAMPEGGRLHVRTVNVPARECERYHAKGMPAGDYVLVEVRDTGTGIPESILGKIFDPFFSTKEVGKGTGLGLSTVYGIIKQTGGFVYVDSVVHQGTTFRIFLPRHILGAEELAEQAAEAAAITHTLVAAEGVKRAAAGTPAKAPAAVDLTGQGTILWSRTKRACARSTPAASRRAATPCWKPATASKPSRCWKARTSRSISSSPTWSCRRWTARRLARELRTRNPELKIIFVSGYAEDAFQKNLPEHGQFAFLPKPFTLKQLVAAVKETLAA